MNRAAGTANKWHCRLRKIVSGGQTGVDRAALDAAISAGFSHGGWCPKGRLSEDQPIPKTYNLIETESAKYTERTLRNVMESDGTLILYVRDMRGGTFLTLRSCKTLQKPHLAIKMPHQETSLERVFCWLVEHRIETLNVAGPRASKEPLVYSQAVEFMSCLLGKARFGQNENP